MTSIIIDHPEMTLPPRFPSVLAMVEYIENYEDQRLLGMMLAQDRTDTVDEAEVFAKLGAIGK